MTWWEGLRTKLREVWTRLRGGDLTPWRAAASVAVGLAIGVTPLWGVHFWLVLAVCVPLQLDVPVAYLAANISLPFIAPFLSLAEIEIGARLRTGSWLPLTADALRTHGVRPFLAEIVLGTAIFAPAVALVGGSVTYVMARLWSKAPRRASESDAYLEVFRRVAERYARGRRATRGYVQSKLAHDPVVRTVLDLAGPSGFGDVTDVGCGRGQLGLVLLEAARARRVVGFDWDADKVLEGMRAASGLAAELHVGDLRDAPIAPCDVALLIDVLHYLTDEEQAAVVSRAADAARSRVIVRELDPDRGWRSKVTRIQEAITTTVRFNRGARVRIRSIGELVAGLEARGFDTDVTPCWKGTPFSNVLVVGTRRARDERP